MSKIECFEDIQAWQEARILIKESCAISGSGQWAKDYALRDQIRLASISVLTNSTNDAQGARYLGSFIRYLRNNDARRMTCDPETQP
ncbi:MAG: four helix bundle protein [Dissulfurimicrobium sp.]|uniref:four helix bundle protein n=1 Tax=Dissulfurimicrobium TaxID=1769732 RepID=UPI001EDA2220|nr:four helix bundle protein [Dissulfurimicrobium hydrothermale]UKL13968.1 four helix bundle protein [Dissulfurimicrobium hydrothermale]